MTLRALRTTLLFALSPLLLLAGCTGASPDCLGSGCGTLVIAAPGEPTTLLPAITDEALDRDIFDQLFLKLADIGPDERTTGSTDFQPQLAASWSQPNARTLVFHLDPRARWHDGQPVTAADVAFTFAAYTDSTLDSPYRDNLAHIRSVVATDSTTVTFTFDRGYPEMFFDAVYHMRILPAHLLQRVPRGQWRSTEFGRTPVGDGPFRFVRWTTGQAVELAADTAFFLGRPKLQRVIWRFTPDLTVAVTQVVAGDADAIQVLVTPANIERASKAGHLTLVSYPGSVYALMAFNLRANGDRGRPHPLFADAEVRRAIVLATDRVRMARSVFGEHAKVPPAPISQMWQDLWFSDLAVPPFDTTTAVTMLEQRGWRRGPGDGIRARNGVRLSFHLAVPSTSGSRKQYAQLLQEQLRRVGVEVIIDELEAATMQERERSGAYDAAIEAWNTDPSPASSIPEAWLRGAPANFGGYDSPAFDQAVARALGATTADSARQGWHDALATLAGDAPAVMLYALDNVAAVDARFRGVRLRPDYPWAWLREWSVPPDRLTTRDRAGH